jgi:hypothetical protein
VRPLWTRPEAVTARHGPGRFLGELNLLTGQSPYLTARVVRAGEITRVTPERFRRLMAEQADLSDVVLRAFLARRQILRTGEGARSIEMLRSNLSEASLALSAVDRPGWPPRCRRPPRDCEHWCWTRSPPEARRPPVRASRTTSASHRGSAERN